MNEKEKRVRILLGPLEVALVGSSTPFDRPLSKFFRAVTKDVGGDLLKLLLVTGQIVAVA